MTAQNRNCVICAVVIVLFLVALALAETPEKTVSAADGLTVSVKTVGPAAQVTSLQVICILKHDPAGDKYIEAMADLNGKLGGLLSALRNRGEFSGDLGETLLLTPPANSIPAKKLLLIAVGPESNISAETLGFAGRIAEREAASLRVTDVSFAATMRDQGSKRVDVGDCDAATVEQFLLAFDTETRLAAQKLGDPPSVKSLVIEAGPKFFESATEKVTSAVNLAQVEIKARDGDPYLAFQK